MPRFPRLFILPAAILSLGLVACLEAAAGPLEARVVGQGEAVAVAVFRPGGTMPLLSQEALATSPPVLQPMSAPDGRSLVAGVPGKSASYPTIYWRFAGANERVHFSHPYERVSVEVNVAEGPQVAWTTVCRLLGARGTPVMLETQRWTMREAGERFLLDLEWTAQALADVTEGETHLGGLFVSRPGPPDVQGVANNSNRQRDERADGRRAVWMDLSFPLETASAHIAVFDHPLNDGYPLPWRVDPARGIGTSRSALGAWKIAKGQSATFRHQCVIYTGPFDDLRLEEARRAYTGEPNEKALWILARDEAKAAKFLTGEQAVAKMTVADGFEVKLWASEPAIEQPMAFCWDHRGRLWVAENRDYETRKTGFSASGDSRVVILEDTDGDGKMDTRKVFLEGVAFPAGVAVGLGGLWLAAPPNLLFVPDRDADDRPDSEIEVRLTGWGIQDRHETLNSLTWGPDGWLYGCQGIATRSNVGKPADGGRVYRAGEPFPERIPVKDGQPIDGAIWRYHPTKDRFEVVAHGFSNPWGIDFDDHGQMFATACVIPHLWHIVPGGLYHRQGGKHFNPHAYADIATIADHRHRSAHGGARIYLADEFPAAYRGRIFMANIHERALLTDILVPRGSGFIGRHGDEPMQANDPQWVGFSVEIGPDGAVYVLDWHDADICGMGVHDKGTGRIFRFAPKGLPGRAGFDLSREDDLALVGLMSHRNDWYVRRARVLLQERAVAGKLDPRVAPRLWQMFTESKTEPSKLRALWAMRVTGALSADRLRGLLDHDGPHVRAWAVRLLCEDGSPGSEVVAKFAEMARRDASPVVRLDLSSALQRLGKEERWAVVEGLVGHAEDANDHNLPKLTWLGFEPLVPLDPPRALALAAQGEIPLLGRFAARRAVSAGQTEAVTRAVARCEPGVARQSLLEGMNDGLVSLGRRDRKAPADWAVLAASLSAGENPGERGLVTQIAQLFGDAAAAAAQLASLRDPSTPTTRRREILRGFARDSYAPALSEAIALLDDATLRRDAIRALAAFDDDRVPAEILRRYSSWTTLDKSEAILTLTARRAHAESLLNALKRAAVPKRDVSAFAARQLQQVIGPSFVDFWGPITQPAAEKQEEIARYKSMLADDVVSRANLGNGRALFERTCAPCHSLYGQGGMIGPDLTGSNRANLDYILAEIINPSDVIQEGYHLVTVTTRDGRMLAGNLAAEDEHQITLRMIGQDTLVAKSEILSREKSPVSMMPEGLLKLFSNDEVRDLVGYLRTTQQVSLNPP